MALGIRRLSTLVLFSVAVSAAPRRAVSQPATDGEASELRRKARAHFDEGMAAYKAGRYGAAARSFLAADRILPSPVLAFDVARAYDNLGDAARALAFYRDYLRREPAPPNGDAVRGRIDALSASLLARGQALITVLSEPTGAAVSVDGHALGSTPWAGELTLGAHRVIVTKQGYQPQSRHVELALGGAVELALALVPANASPAAAPNAAESAQITPRASSSPSRVPFPDEPNRARFTPWSFVALGAGGAALALAGAFEISRRSAESDARNARTQLAYGEHYDAMRSRQATARVFAVSGGALLAVGGALFVLDEIGKSDSTPVATLAWDGRSCLGTFASSF